MSGRVATLPLLTLALCGTAWAQTGPGAGPTSQTSNAAASRPTSRDEALWQQIIGLHRQFAERSPGASPLADARTRRQTLLEHVQLYLTLYPGGPHRDEAVRMELATMFELAVLEGGELDGLAVRVHEYLQNPPSEGARHEAAYWAILCERAGRAAATQPASAPIDGPDTFLLAGYRDYVERYPTSRYVPRLATVLFEHARQSGDREAMSNLVKRLADSFPDHATTTLLAAQLRREEAAGRTFWMTFRGQDDGSVDTRELVGQVVLIVVWGSFDAGARECVSRVEAFRQAHPQVRVIGVNLDATEAQMSAACDTLGIDWPQFNDGLAWANEFARAWGVRRVPCVFVIDRSGRLAGFAGREGWERLAGDALEN